MSDPESAADPDDVGDAAGAADGAGRREQGDEDAVELRFFANFRQTVGQKSLYRAYGDAATIGDVLVAIEDEFPELAGLILDDGEIQPQINVLRNGREVEHLDGLETPVEPGDAVSVFPPVAGG